VLDGQGADEIFGGYPGHQRILIRHRLQSGRVLDALRELRALAAHQGQALLPFTAAYVWTGISRRFPPDFSYLDPHFGSEPDPAEEAAARDWGMDPSAVNRELHYAIRRGNVRIVLPYSDKNAMAHSIEARVPYFDRAVVELASSLPDHFKVGGGQRKRLLRDLARQRLPRMITERRDKTGFAVNEAAWLGCELWPTVREAASGVLNSAPFRPGRAERYLDDFASGRHADFRAVWRMYAFALWADAFSIQMP